MKKSPEKFDVFKYGDHLFSEMKNNNEMLFIPVLYFYIIIIYANKGQQKLYSALIR